MGVEAIFTTMLPFALARMRQFDTEAMAAAVVDALNGPQFTDEDREKIHGVFHAVSKRLEDRGPDHMWTDAPPAP